MAARCWPAIELGWLCCSLSIHQTFMSQKGQENVHIYTLLSYRWANWRRQQILIKHVFAQPIHLRILSLNTVCLLIKTEPKRLSRWNNPNLATKSSATSFVVIGKLKIFVFQACFLKPLHPKIFPQHPAAFLRHLNLDRSLQSYFLLPHNSSISKKWPCSVWQTSSGSNPISFRGGKDSFSFISEKEKSIPNMHLALCVSFGK